jgi:purine-binding chemotaxis protein CheW
MTANGSVADEVLALRLRLDELERRARAELLSADASVPSAPTEVLVCTALGLRLAVALEDVLEVVPIAATVPLPEAPHWLLGLLDLRGAPVPVLDVAARLSRAPREVVLTDQIVVCSIGARTVGLVVGSVEGLSTFTPDAIRPPSDVPHAAYVRATLCDASGIALLLATRRLVDLSELPDVETEAP